MQTASIRKTTGDILVEFEQSKGTFLTPRGRYAIELYDWFLRLRGQKYDYKVCLLCAKSHHLVLIFPRPHAFTRPCSKSHNNGKDQV